MAIGTFDGGVAPSTRLWRRAAICAVATLLGLATAPAHATFVFAQAGGIGSEEFSSPGFGAAHYENDIGSGSTAEADAEAHEFVGGVASRTEAHASGGVYGRGAIGIGRGGFSDSFQIGASNLSGLDPSVVGFSVRIPLVLSGSDLRDNTGGAGLSNVYTGLDYQWQVGNRSAFYSARIFDNSDGTHVDTISSAGTGPYVDLIVSLGETVGVYLYMETQAYAQASPDRIGSALSNFSLLWGGLESFNGVDAQGNVVALPSGFELTMISANSGFNYVNAAVDPYADVPEPASLAVLLTGALLLAVRRLRRKPASMSPIAAAAAAMLLGQAAAPARAEVTFEGANVRSSYFAIAGCCVGEQGNGDEGQSLVAPGDLDILQQPSFTASGRFAQVTSHITTHFDSARSGTASIDHYLAAGASPPFVAGATVSTSFDYGFTIDRPSLITIDYDLFSTGVNTFGDRPAFNFGLTFIDGLRTSQGVGSLEIRLENPGYYSLYFLTNDDHIATNGLAGGFPTAMSGSLAFDITDLPPVLATPEPSEWLMMVAGLGIVAGAAQRRQRRTTV